MITLALQRTGQGWWWALAVPSECSSPSVVYNARGDGRKRLAWRGMSREITEWEMARQEANAKQQACKGSPSLVSRVSLSLGDASALPTSMHHGGRWEMDW